MRGSFHSRCPTTRSCLGVTNFIAKNVIVAWAKNRIHCRYASTTTSATTTIDGAISKYSFHGINGTN